MSTKAQQQQQQQKKTRTPSHPLYINDGLTPKKTALIIVTVIGCIAILWPKVFHPMLFGQPVQKPAFKEHRGPGGGCCDVVLDREKFMNATPPEFGPQLYRKTLNLYTGEISLRQERPAHLHPESIYQAMKERGRAIPPTQTIPIVERKISPSNPPPRIVEGRPGPIPGMRPPMGAGALHQPQQKGNSMGFIMPLYTIGIIVFFGYTIMKLVSKKPIPNAPYGSAPSDPNFRKEVFGQENGRHVEDLNGSKLATVASNLSSSLKQQQQQHQHMYHHQSSDCQTAFQHPHQLKEPQGPQPSALDLKSHLIGFNKETEQLMEIEKLRRKLEDTEKAMAKLIAEMNSDQYEAKQTSENSTTSNVEHISSKHTTTLTSTKSNEHKDGKDSNGKEAQEIKANNEISSNQNQEDNEKAKTEDGRKKRDSSLDRSVTVMGMEITASCEGGKKWTGRPSTPVFLSHSEHSKREEDFPEPQSIYLEGSLPHESKILVADSEIKQEEVYDTELNGTPEEPAVILSSKMTLSLINLDTPEENSKPEVESPLADDIEIIGHDD